MNLEKLQGIMDLRVSRIVPGDELSVSREQIVTSLTVLRELKAALAEGLEDIGPAPDDPRAQKFVIDIRLVGKPPVVLIVDEGVISTNETSYLFKSDKLWPLLESITVGMPLVAEPSGTPCLEPLELK